MKPQRGSIFTEVAIVLVVIVALALLAAPIWSGSRSAAKMASAQTEILALAEAEREAAADIGFYVPLQLLDDMPAPSHESRLRDIQSVREDARLSEPEMERRIERYSRIAAIQTPLIDAIGNEPPSVLLVDPALADDSAMGEQVTLEADQAAIGAAWGGPYHHARRVWLGGPVGQVDPARLDAAARMRDYPLDPWGTPYRFYSPLGLIGSHAASGDEADFASDGYSDGAVTSQDDRFTTFAIVSYGPDGESDSVSGADDDILYLFESGKDE